MSDEPKRTCSPDQAFEANMVSPEERLREVIGSTLFENRIVSVNITVPSLKDPFSEEEAAAYLKVPEDSVRYFAVRMGEIAYCDLGKGRRAYLRKDLDDFLARRREPSIYEKDKARSPRRKGAET